MDPGFSGRLMRGAFLLLATVVLTSCGGGSQNDSQAGADRLQAQGVVSGSVATFPSVRANYGVTNAISATTIAVYNSSGTMIASNAGWQSTQQAAIQATGLAPLSTNEAAVLLTVNPGAYTMQVSGTNGVSGIALVEAFVITPTP